MIPERAARHARRGGILLEVLLSLALFVGAATLALGASRSVLGAIDRSTRRALAADLARSKLAELELGLTTIAELRESAEGIDRVGSLEQFGDPGAGGASDVWIIDVVTTPSEYTGLTLVELTVSEEDAAGAASGGGARHTLRQLVRLRGEDADDYEIDDMLRDLPAPSQRETSP